MKTNNYQMDSIINDRIGWWMVRARNLRNKGLRDEFIRFFIYYMCLDAWITNESGEYRDEEKIKWLVNNGGILKRVFVNKEFDRSDSVALKGFSPIQDMRPNRQGRFTYLSDAENFAEVVRFIYQIRCNLFHGGKNPMNEKDSNLVFLAGEFLGKWMRWAHIQFNSS